MAVHIGTSGWQYRHWKRAFYPEGLPQSAWLEHYSERFATVEVNNTFYRLPEAKTFEEWAARTPAGFVFALKASRYLTHLRRLRDPKEPVRMFMERAERLGAKLGPILLQLPPNLKADRELLLAALGTFPVSVRVAVEFRHDSWFEEQVRAVIEKAGAALCLADSPSRKTPLWRTAEWTYVRFHEGRATPNPCYGRKALDGWASRLAAEWGDGADIYAYFNNDTRACALRDAGVFSRAVERHGLASTRVPATREIEVF